MFAGCGRSVQQKYMPAGARQAEKHGEAVDVHLNKGQPAAMEQAKAKKPRPLFCFRCKCVGHLQETCTADLDCYVCNKKKSHLGYKCPILKLPKPVVTMSGCA